MILLVREGCTFCQGLDLPKSVKFEVVQTPNGPMIKTEGGLISLPANVTGIPALIDGSSVYIGREPIMERMKELGYA